MFIVLVTLTKLRRSCFNMSVRPKHCSLTFPYTSALTKSKLCSNKIYYEMKAQVGRIS